MIRNLSQENIRKFGTLVTEPFPKDSAAVLPLNEKDAVVLRTTSQTWLSAAGGTCVLSVSSDGNQFVQFQLDKPVQLVSGVLFALNALHGAASVLLYAASAPEDLGTRPCRQLALARSMRVDAVKTFLYQEKEPGFVCPGAVHSLPELTYVDEGELHSVVDGQDLLLKKGELVLYGANQWHMQYADIGVAPRFVTISFEMRGTDLRALQNRSFPLSQQTAQLMQQLRKEHAQMDACSDSLIVSQLNQLLLLLLREAGQLGRIKPQSANSHNENEIIRHAQQYIAAHIREKLSVPMVAQQVEVSANYLTLLFQKNLRISPSEYIRRIKLEESKQMIRENDLNFTQIAAALQYSTVHHFSRQFKEKFGITPTEYAKSVR